MSASAPRLGAISPPKSNRRRHLFVLLAVSRWSGFAKLPDSMSCAVNTRTCACNALLGRSHYNFSTPVTLTFTLVAAPKLNLYPPAAHLKFKAVGRIPAAQTHIHFGSNRNLFFFFSFCPEWLRFIDSGVTAAAETYAYVSIHTHTHTSMHGRKHTMQHKLCDDSWTTTEQNKKHHARAHT